MADRDTCLADTLDVTRKFKIAGQVEGVFGTPVTEDFQTEPVERLALTFEGVPGDRHAGFTRKSGGREPWYPRGTEMCNERQISILSMEELAIIADRMEIPELRSEWIGGNITLSGIPSLSLIPPRTRLEFEGGVVIRVDGDNAPVPVCRIRNRSPIPGPQWARSSCFRKKPGVCAVWSGTLKNRARSNLAKG